MKRLTLLAALLPIGCAMGPNYHRPAVDVPGKYREAAPPAQSEPMDTASMGDSGWWQVYSDPNLQALLDTALKNNFDVKTALARQLHGLEWLHDAKLAALFINHPDLASANPLVDADAIALPEAAFCDIPP